MEPEGQEGHQPASLQADLQQRQTRHEKLRSSFFSTSRGRDNKPHVLARDFTAVTAALGAPSSQDSSDSEGETEGRILDPEALRDAMAVDAAGGGTNESDSPGDEPRGGGGGGGGGSGGGGGDGGGEISGDNGERHDGAQNPYKGKHWSSAAASCVLHGFPPSPRAAAAVAAHAAARKAGSEGRGGRRGHGRGRGSDFSCGDGCVFSSSSGDGGSVSTDGPTEAAVAALPSVSSGTGESVAAGGTTAAGTATAVGNPAKNRPRPRTIWERGGGAPTPKKEWRKLIDSPKRTVSEAEREFQRRGREGAGAGSRGAAGVSGEGAAGKGDDAVPPGRVKHTPTFMQGRRWPKPDWKCCTCCRTTATNKMDSGEPSSSSGDRNTARRQTTPSDYIWRKRPSSSSNSNGGGSSGVSRLPNLRTHAAEERKDRYSDRSSHGGGSAKGRPSGIKASASFLAVGLALEVAATVWAFQRAVAAGALAEDPDCSSDGDLFLRHSSLTVQEECEEPGDDSSASYLSGDVGYASCDLLLETRSSTEVEEEGEDFLDLCSCDSEEPVLPTPCLLVALSSENDDACYARAIDPEAGFTLVPASSASYSCWAKSPTGAEGLAVTALVLALAGQAAEAAAGVLCLRGPWRPNASILLMAAAGFQALGAVATAAVLASVVEGSEDSGGGGSDDALFSALAATVAAVIAGVVLEGVPAGSERVRRALPYLGAVGNMVLWLGVAILQVLVVAYFVWQAADDGGLRRWDVLRDEIGGLLVVEALGLLALWTARVLWTRAKLLTAVEGREGPSRRQSSRFGRFDSV